MSCFEYKITFEYDRPLLWSVSVWQREVQGATVRGPWVCVLHREAATLEGHMDAKERLRQVMRSLAS